MTTNAHLIHDEELKQMQKLKEEFENRKSSLDDCHRYFINRVAKYLFIKPELIEDLMCEAGQLEYVNDFLKPNGSDSLCVFNFECDEIIKIINNSGKKCYKRYKDAAVLFSTGNEAFKEKGVIFIKLDGSIQLTNKNIFQETTAIKLMEDRSLLGTCMTLLNDLYIPIIRNQASGFGEISDIDILLFNKALQNFNKNIDIDNDCVREQLVMDKDRGSVLSSVDAILEKVRDPEAVSKAEERVAKWMKILQKEVTNTQLLRVESGVLGPHQEFKYWRKQMTRFNSLLDQLRLNDIVNTLYLLKFARSKVLKNWINLNQLVNEAFIEAQQNSRILNSIENYCMELYHNNIENIVSMIPKLIKNLGMIYTHSRYYSTFTYMTQLFIKITSQMIGTCCQYITDDGTLSIWSSDVNDVMKRMLVCIELNHLYQKSYHEAKETMVMEQQERIFDFSEVQIFGNFNYFEKRLIKLLDLLKSMKNYGILQNVALEGKEPILYRYEKLSKQILSKTYNFLNHRNSKFDHDYEDFKTQTDEIHAALVIVINQFFHRSKGVMAGLMLQGKIENINIPDIDHQSRYLELLKLFETEIIFIRQKFYDHHSNPPIDRNMPYFAGRIAWARNLYLNLEHNMNGFLNTCPDILETQDGVKVVKLYNKTTETLVKFEIKVYHTWKKLVLAKLNGMKAPIFIIKKYGFYGECIPNMDPDVMSILREINVLDKLGCTLTSKARMVCIKEDFIKSRLERVRFFCSEHKRIVSMIPTEYESLLLPLTTRLYNEIIKGSIHFDWCCFGVETYLQDTLEMLYKLDLLLTRSFDIRKYRINEVLERISATDLFLKPVNGEPWDIDKFVEYTNENCIRASQFMNSLSFRIFVASNDFINLLSDEFDTFVSSNNLFYLLKAARDSNYKEMMRLQFINETEKHVIKIVKAIDDLIRSINQKTVYCVIESVKRALNQLWNYVGCKDAAFAVKDVNFGQIVVAKEVKPNPLFHCYLRIMGNQLGLKPSIEEIQIAIKNVVSAIQMCTSKVMKWTEHNRSKEPIDLDIESNVNRKQISIKDNVHVPILVEDAAQLSRTNSTLEEVQEYDQTRETLAPSGGPNEERTKTKSKTVNTVTETSRESDNCLMNVKQDREINRLQTYLQTWANSYRMILFLPDGKLKEIDSLTEILNDYEFLWTLNPVDEFEKFKSSNATMCEYQAKFKELKNLEDQLNDEVGYFVVGPFYIDMTDFKLVAMANLKQFQQVYMSGCLERYVSRLEQSQLMIEEIERNLTKNITNLDDIAFVMDTLQYIRTIDIKTDYEIMTAEYALQTIASFDLPLPKATVDMVESIRCNYNKLKENEFKAMDNILRIQGSYKDDLMKNIAQLKVDIDALITDYQDRGPMKPGLPPVEALDKQILFRNRWDNLNRKQESLRKGENLFGLMVSEYPNFVMIGKELELLQRLYGLYNEVNRTVSGYYEIPWSKVDMEKISADLSEFQVKCKRLPKALKTWPAYTELQRTIDEFNEKVPLLELMTNKAMKSRHWQRLSELIQMTLEVESENFTLKTMLEAPLLKVKEDVEDVCVSAVREQDIEAKFTGVVSEWSSQELLLAPFKQRGNLLLKGDRVAEIVGMLEDSLMVLGSLMNNRYNKPFKKMIGDWVSRLTTTSEVLEHWMRVQNLWVYLEAVFVGGDIAKQMPLEARRFQSIDKSYVKVMERTKDTPGVVACCSSDQTLIELLPRLSEQLELCQKSLTGYLESKRLLFPRFFFVSDPVLLEILGQASDTHSIQQHLLSVFDNVHMLQFNDHIYDQVIAAYSQEKEKITMDRPVMCEGHVESWLGTLLLRVQQSLHAIIHSASCSVQDDELDIVSFLEELPAQVGLLGIQILWTKQATDALREARSDSKVMGKTNRAFLALLNLLISQTKRELTKYARTKFETLITIHLHQRDIFDDLVKQGIRSPVDFEWTKQTRFYFMEEVDKCVVCITDVTFEYQNEFLGCTERLVITPLTDRCYITISQALNMSLGAAPAGPAGTGKTETTKDMGRCLGKYVVVFNCSDQMDFRGLGRIFKGLAQSGSWGCFDEFNRIELPVLSVAAQQIAIVLQSKKEGKSQFIFSDGDTVDMNPEFGLFLTMNPGYAGRQELPENLKINFRSVAMMVPDRQIIIRVKLAACGFIENVVLARKFYVLYKLCEEQLTKQVHYDFGLRNILSVLRSLGAARRVAPGDSEEKTVMRVLRDMNLSKLVDQDESLFLSLVNDLFPGISLEKAGYPELMQSVETQVENAGLVPHPPWVLKVIQLYETQLVRHGMMTLGPSGAGKTACINILMRALTDLLQKPHRDMRMNPKAITASEMFGKLDVATNDWTDGIFSTLWRRTLKLKKGEHCWIVLDGPVDAIWIENLNSVLDDNKTLTLANGDRIPMGPNCKIVFEVHNIDNASPATVSRNGMVFMSSSALNWSPILKGWLLKRPAIERDQLYNLFDKSLPVTYKYVINNLDLKMAVLEAFIVRQACDLLEGMIPQEGCNPVYLERLFVFALMWSVGAFLEIQERFKLEEFVYSESEIAKLHLPPSTNKAHSMFDYKVNNEGEWEHWSHSVEEYVYPKDYTPDYSQILVPNVDNVRTEFLVHTICKQHKSVLLIGEQGSAKTVMLSKYLLRADPATHIFKMFNFSSATTPALFQRTIESFVEKRVGATFGPPPGKKMTVFIDDINMPIINDWGDQIANEIVRQTMEMKGFYNLEKPGDFITITDVQLVAAMNQPGGGRNDIPERLKRQFCIFNCTLPSNTSIDKIFSVIGTGHYCRERGFSTDIIQLATQLVPLTRCLWQLTKQKMLPTPAKFHYVFNLRDLSRIWQGLINTQPDVIDKPETLIALWKHECMRVISDRFVSPQDETWFLKTMHLVIKDSTEIPEDLIETLNTNHYFVDFLREAPEPTGDEPEDFDFSPPKIYEPVKDLKDLQERLQQFMSQYNESIRGAGMDLVFFTDCMLHLIKISRIIRTPLGNALLVGVGGSGKQSITKLAAFIAGYRSFQITLSRTYNVTNLLEDLKELYRSAGQDGKGTTFIFTDNDIKDEAFLEYMNNILASGVVSGLFGKEDMDEILGNLIPIMKKEFPKRQPTNENLVDYFFSRVRKHLHVVLCFSPVGQKFRKRALYFPGLISGCVIDWFQKWPKDALVAVATHYLGNHDLICDAQTKQNIIQLVALIHDDVTEKCNEYLSRYRRVTHVTPKSYLSFLESYGMVYGEKRDQLSRLAVRMDSGLQKLVEAQESVGVLSVELVDKEKELEVAGREAEKVLESVTQQTEAALIVKDKVQQVKDRCLEIVQSINVEREVAEARLEAAKPALLEAEEALNTIRPTDISTVRKLAKPPHLIMRIMDCVLLLFQRPLDPVTKDMERGCIRPSWAESLKLMAQGGFLNNLLNFSRDCINGETVDLLESYLEAEDYNLETAKKVCGNVAGLLAWTCAMEKFYWVNCEVIPLKDNLAKQQAALNKATEKLASAEALLQEKERLLAVVQAEYDAAMRRKQMLQDDADSCRRRIQTSRQLIEGLSGEKTRWTEQSAAFRDGTKKLVGDVLVCTAFLSYTGPFNQDFRLRMLSSWANELARKNIPATSGLDIIKMLAEPTTVSEWNLQGLPSDELSTQNGIIVTSAARYPLLIDPQNQGRNWIKKKEISRDLQVSNLNHKYFRQHLEDALSLGRPMLIEDVHEELDPALDNVLEKNFIKMGSGYKVKLGDKEVDVCSGFMLYITTKLPNPHYTPEIYAKTSVIDFTVTIKGLEDQLLGRVIKTEKEELERSRIELIENMTNNKRRMQDLEQSLLERLANTQGSLVDDQDLLDVLNNTKTTSQEVSVQLTQAVETEREINTAREEYRPVATRGSVMYFLFTEMTNVNQMYQMGLKQFLGLFDRSMTCSDKCPITQRRISIIIDWMTFDMWKFSVRGMYKEDRTTMTLLLALKIDLQARNVRQEEFDVFIKGGSVLNMNSVPPKPGKWITDLTWLNLNALSVLNQFTNIIDQVSHNEKQWRQWYDKDSPENEILPCSYETYLDPFRRLLLVRSWCPDRTLPQARKYIAKALGPKFAEEVLLDMEKLFSQSDCRSPLINLLSTGSDATPLIEQLAKKKHVICRCVSMGQGQEIPARKLVAKFMSEGGWVLLQNCHLCLHYLEELFLQLLEVENVHPSYRLWLTTEYHTDFSINMLQVAVKFTNEPPEGIKANLQRTYSDITQDLLDSIVTHHWKSMLFALASMHGTIQERRKFGPLGWNLPYEFNQSDFNATMQFLQNHLDNIEFKKSSKTSGVDWKCVQYMISEIQYGGRVTDDYDKVLLVTLSKTYFQERMFSSEFCFFTPQYTIPVFTSVPQYINYISDLPVKDSPEALGLHSNADITYSTKTTRIILDTILSIQPKDASGGGETRESVVLRQCADMLSKLPLNYIPHQVHERLQKLGALQPMNIFLRQELDRMNRVIKMVRSNLTDLQLAIHGTIIMNEQLRDALDSLFDAKVPLKWLKISWESSTLGFWFSELLDRNLQFSRWLNEGRPNTFWMTGFFNPQGFLTAMRQEATRKNEGWALDTVVLGSRVTKHTPDDLKETPKDGVLVAGLFLEGGAWDRRHCRLTEPRPKELFDIMPLVHIFAVQQASHRASDSYMAPLYRKPRRTSATYVAEIELSCSKTPDHWIMRGVALLCDIK